MMGAIWMVACASEGYPAIAREVRTLDAGARLVCVPGVAEAWELARELHDEEVVLAVAVSDADEVGLEEKLATWRSFAEPPRIVAFADAAKPGLVSRLLYEGASEVITVGEMGGNAPKPAVRMEGDPSRGDGGSVPHRDDTRCDRYEDEEELDARLRYEVRTAQWADLDEPGEGAGREAPFEHDRVPDEPPQRLPEVPAGEGAHRAPVVTVVSGRGGVGRTTLVAAMACFAARCGLRTAVLDLDLMFGDLHRLLGVEEPRDLGMLAGGEGGGMLSDALVEESAMRVGPGLTLWGPAAAPECVELLGRPCEQLIEVLRGLADVIFIDTPVSWGDAAAAAVAVCDRCLVVSSLGATSCPSASHVAELATRLGVPRTRMMGVVNRLGSHGVSEEAALRQELALSLGMRARVADGGDEVASMLSFGQMDDLIAGEGAFARDVRALASGMLRELGCPVGADAAGSEDTAVRPRLRLPWGRRAGTRAGDVR